MAIHNQLSFIREYCLCRRIPYKFHGETLVVGTKEHSFFIYSVFNFTYVDLIRIIDNKVEYNNFGYFVDVKEGVR